MYFYNNAFAELAARIRHGDLAAKIQLREQLENEMIHIVRRTLNEGNEKLPLDRRIMAEARRIRAETRATEIVDRDRLIREVTRRLCDSVIAQLRPVKNNVLRGDTVCNPPIAATQMTV